MFIILGSTLPRTTTDLFASPDETTVMQFARAWSPSTGFRIPHGLPDDISSIASLHSRSIIRQGDYLVPVGFLGMPFLVALIEKLGTGIGSYLTLLLVLSSIYPLWQLAKRTNSRVATITVLIYLSFPTVLLYVNRGLFPNLPLLAFVIWAIWLISESKKWKKKYFQYIYPAVAGVLLGFAFIIRPVEAIWILPWIAWAVWLSIRSDERKNIWKLSYLKPFLVTGIVTLLVCMYGVILAMQTYPYHSSLADQPVIGYLLTDRANDTEVMSGVNNGSESTGLSSYLPFGFHPRVMWENIKAYFFTYLGIWVGAALLGLYIAGKKKWGREENIFILLILWTIGSLLLFYGQALYTDNIRGNISLGNSFLRYIIPLTPLIAYGCARFIDYLFSLEFRGNVMGSIVSILLISLGIIVAFAHDEEGILQTRYELNRYATIRDNAIKAVEYPAIILSERSDKIFSSGPFVTVSPIPDAAALEALSQSPYNVYLFHRTFGDDDEFEESLMQYFQISINMFEIDNESFYELSSSILDFDEIIEDGS